jgi:hypothetical protein
MITEDREWEVCDKPLCEEKIKNHRWGRTKAEGWFFEKTGEAWCPLHHPEWVADWRARQKAKG